MDPNQRKSERFDSLNLISFVVRKDDQEIAQGMGRTLNVSQSGMLLEISFPVSIQNSLSISLGLADEVVELSADIIHCTQESKSKHKLGCRFQEMDSRARQVLDQYISRFQASMS